MGTSPTTAVSTSGAAVRRGGPPTRWVALILLGEVMLSLALGFHALRRKSLWYDEAFSAMAAGRGLAGAWDVARNLDANMPLYVHGLGVWRVLGDGEATLRALSVVAAAASVVAVYLLAARLFDRWTGLLAGFLLAIAPFAVRYSQELRGYSLLLVLGALSSFAFVSAIDSHRRSWFVLYAVATAAAFYAHLAAAFVVVAQLVSLWFIERDAIPKRPLVPALGLTALLLVPLGLFVVSAADSQGTPERPNLRSVPRYLANAAGGLPLLFVYAGLAVVPIVSFIAAWRATGRSRDTWRLAFVLASVAVPFVGLLAVAVVQQRGWHDRYLIVLLPGIVICAAVTLRRIPSRMAVIGVLVVIATLSGVKIRHWYRGPSLHDWRGAVAYVARQSRPGDGIVFCYPYHRIPFEYYWLEHPEAALDPISPADPWSRYVHVEPVAPGDVAWQRPRRVWVLPYDRWRRTGVCERPAVTAGRTRAVRRVTGSIVIERYDRDDVGRSE
ncbi:MAG: hypothetical protein AMXMBFR46_12740 [Acidimicrobiia bacterium]